MLSYPGGSIADGTPLVMEPGNGDLSTPWHVSFHHYMTGGDRCGLAPRLIGLLLVSAPI